MSPIPRIFPDAHSKFHGIPRRTKINGPQHGKYCGDTVASLLTTDFQSTNCPVTLKASWQKQVLACSGYLELGMLDDAANALEKIQPDDKPRKEVLYAQVGLYVASKKWKMAAVVAGHLVKAEPANPGAWINLAYLVRRAENVEEAETVLFKARDWHPKNALIAFNLACYASVAGRMEEAKVRLLHAIDLDKDIRRLALDDKDLRPLWDWIGDVTS